MADEPKLPHPFQEFVKFGKFFSSRLVHSVVQARLGREQFVPLPCRQFTDATDWFNVRIDELGEVSSQLRSNIARYPPLSPTLALDFLLQTQEGGVLPLETWCISYESTEVGAGRYTRTELYQQLSVALKSVIAASRITPSYRYFVRKQGSESYIILYRVSETPIKLDYGEDSKKIRVATVVSPFGSLYVDLTFRTTMVLERSCKLEEEVGGSKASTSHLPTFDPDDLDLPTRIPFGPVPTSGDYISASPDSDVFTCFSTSPASQNEFSMATSPLNIPTSTSPRGSTHFRIGVSPASSNESFLRRGSDEMLLGSCSAYHPSCSLPERTIDKRLITRTRQTSFPFSTLLSASPPSQFYLNKQILRNNTHGDITVTGPSTALGLPNVDEEDLCLPNLRKSCTAPVPVNLLENLQLENGKKRKQRRDDDSSEDEDDIMFPMTDIFGRVFRGSSESAASGPVELIQQCKIANLHNLNFLRNPVDTDVNAVVDTLADFENKSRIFDTFVSEISAEREDNY